MDDDTDNLEALNKLQGDLELHFSEYSGKDAIVVSHAISTGDDELINLIQGFRKLRDKTFDSIIKNEEKQKIRVNIVALDAIASKTDRRIEFLVEQANPIGGPYHNKKHIFQFFKRKAK